MLPDHKLSHTRGPHAVAPIHHKELDFCRRRNAHIHTTCRSHQSTWQQSWPCVAWLAVTASEHCLVYTAVGFRCTPWCDTIKVQKHITASDAWCMHAACPA
jgi:hypothetical protein